VEAKEEEDMEECEKKNINFLVSKTWKLVSRQDPNLHTFNAYRYPDSGSQEDPCGSGSRSDITDTKKFLQKNI